MGLLLQCCYCCHRFRCPAGRTARAPSKQLRLTAFALPIVLAIAVSDLLRLTLAWVLHPLVHRQASSKSGKQSQPQNATSNSHRRKQSRTQNETNKHSPRRLHVESQRVTATNLTTQVRDIDTRRCSKSHSASDRSLIIGA